MSLRRFIPWVAAGCIACSLSAGEITGIVNFSTCITNSKYGKKEQENFEGLRKKLSDLIDTTEKELKEVSAKFEDTEYLDSLSPKAEEELKARYQTLNEDLGRYQSQFYQVMQQANMQLIQKLNGYVGHAAEKVAKERKLDAIINKDACFYFRPELDITPTVVAEMDRNFEVDAKTKKVSDNSEEPSAAKEELAEHAE